MNKIRTFIIVIVGQALFTNCVVSNKFVVWTNEEPPYNNYRSYSVFKKNNKTLKNKYIDSLRKHYNKEKQT